MRPDSAPGTGGGNGGPSEGGASMEAGPSRNLLCGISGCDPGNVSACGAPATDGGPYAFPVPDGGTGDGSPDAAETSPDAAADTSVSARPDAGSADAPTDTHAATSVTEDAATDMSSGTNAPDAAEASADASNTDAANETSTADAIAISVEAGDADEASVEPNVVEGCYLAPSPTGIVSACAPLGHGGDGSACDDSSDCGALLGCVDVDGKTACRPLSCALPPTCPSGTFYQETPLRVQGITRTDLKVPVCLPNDNCAILAPTNPCSNGEVCAIVGSQGETTCIVPGVGKQNDNCDEANRCAEGLVCTKFSNKCVKLCHVDSAQQECPGGACQGGNNSIPDGFGICVGETTDGG